MILDADEIVKAMNEKVLSRWNTILVGGFAEPLYLPPEHGRPAEIQFVRDYTRSALHELAHWCIAGQQRRTLVDYGYWYAPDGRSSEQQEEFFRVEVKPQALEFAFSKQCQIPFEVSCDNLYGGTIDKTLFEGKVAQQLEEYEKHGFPARAQEVRALLESVCMSR